MIRALRTRLVAAAMLSLLVVLVVILGAILLNSYRGIVSDADRILDLLAEGEGTIPTLPAVLFGLTLPWAWVLICRYAPISRWWKGTACLGAACVFLPLVNPVIDRLVRLGGGTVERLHGFWFRPDFTRWAENWYFNENVLLLLWLALVAAAALCALRALLRRREA